MTTHYDRLYEEQFWQILKEGCTTVGQDVRTVWNDKGVKTPAHTIEYLNKQLRFESGAVPILTSKYVYWKLAIKEMFWIWVLKSNVVNDLRMLNGTPKTVWSEWELPDGTIGHAYGWQLKNKKRKVKITKELEEMALNGELGLLDFTPLGKDYVELDQVNHLLYTLKTNPTSRRIKTTLWCVEDLDDMSLEPCVYETHWQTQRGELHLTVNVRSNDLGLGQPFNVFQYYVLQCMVAQVTGLKIGSLVFNIDNVHVYDRHIMPMLQQMQNETYRTPELWIDPKVKSFYDFTPESFALRFYDEPKLPRIQLQVAE
ncbi:thymidylate synthase [Bacillus phage PBC4]|uniref:thymidylate synthase n=1 Tax=Bacillus phage PBC4 TaxID=1675028 RepID=A0A1D6X879_9CAUD|nr:thymidylate synthase [Bacillus phage PBC4]AKQ08225.1 thymidylate synthase [Bacillus phage PBC4]